MPPSMTIKIAIVGTGLIGPRHGEAVLNVPEAELACVVDPNPAAQAVADKLKCPLYLSVQSMLASESKPDAALVCTPNHTHVPIAKELLEAGLHVLCEKPISVDVASAKELIECAELYDRKLLIGHHRRFNRYVIATKKHIPNLGQIVAVNGLWTLYKPAEYFDTPTEWRRSSTAGPVLINFIHDVDILQYLFGPIVRVFAEETLSQRGYPAEEGAAITLKFDNGIVGTFILSDAVASAYNFESGTGENPAIYQTGQDFYRILGSEGTLSVPDMTLWSYGGGRKSWAEAIQAKTSEVQEMRVPFELQIQHFVRVINGLEAPNCSGIEGLQAVAVCEAIKKSMREKQPVELAKA
ncbi:hypothetical protein K491DRAFT_751840 [Lophiostoma macrostomum CBS 122681]|uniref:NAD(P)-binding protein n=1 Tax=Lophiostoma macrostomum CBS 122681 TaxID=1314788 RepID=A0A6A6T2B6_9PLEO|nr:hypothetical protein K491DRAFT_751840 [Lophiostoma macrostomum CBS 122681]